MHFKFRFNKLKFPTFLLSKKFLIILIIFFLISSAIFAKMLTSIKKEESSKRESPVNLAPLDQVKIETPYL